MLRLCELYPGICLTTEEKARKNLSQVSQRVPVGMMKTEYTEEKQNIYIYIYIHIQGSRNRPGVAQMVPGGLGSKIS